MTKLLEQALVFIASAIILVPIFRKLRLGSVLGYLMAGILVGPHGLKLIEDPQSVFHFAELGVFFLLFIIGLEIHPSSLWSMKRQLFALGGLQILFCFLVFTTLALTFHLPLPLATIVGLSLSLSSTAFSLQTLTERNQLKTEFGQASFSILLMQDLVAIPTLALIPLLASTATPLPSLSFVPITMVMIILIMASHFLIRPLFRLIAITRMQEIFTAATLFIVLGVAVLMQKLGLSAAFGTFIAGVLMANSEYRHEIEADLQPFKGLLMGLFFIAVGMSVSLQFIISRPLLIFSMATLYLLIKTGLIYLTGRLFKLNHENAKQMGMTISQGGEFAFVIFNLVTQLSLASSELIELLTAVITLSMAFNPLLILCHDLTLRWAVRFQKSQNLPSAETSELDHEVKNQNPETIIAGFGRFGQIFGRILKAQNIPFVAIDHDSEHIELVRRFDTKVFYGDASRRDLLEAAGASKAKYFILCIDDHETSLRVAHMVILHFPHLQIFARARNRGHVFDLMDLGVKLIKRETLDSSLNFAAELLITMGFENERAKDIIRKFNKHDERMLIEQYQVRTDDKLFISVSKQGAEQLSEVLKIETSQSYIELKTDEAK